MNVTSGLKLTEEDVSSGRHVVGTRKEDLLQYYTGKITIHGSLTLTNVRTDSDLTQILASDRPFTMDVENHYWVDHKSQTIPSFKFLSTVTAPQLFTKTINSHPASDYLLKESSEHKHTKIVFKHVNVPGNVIPESDSNTKLVQIAKECVKRGDSFDFKGTLDFDGELSVDFLSTVNIDGYEVENFALQDATSYHFKTTKHLNYLKIYGDLYSSEKFNVQNYNGTDFVKFMSHAVYIHEPFYLENVAFDELRVNNLTVNEMQGIRFDHFVTSVYSVLNSSTSVRNIRVSENAFFEHELHVEMVNDVNVQKLYETIVRKDRGAVINGVKTFNSGLKVKQNVYAPKINGYELQHWRENALNRNSEQIISGFWTFDRLKTKFLEAKILNEIHTKNLLNAKDAVLDIYSDVTVENLKGISTCKATLKHDINTLMHAIHNPMTKSFDTVTCESTLLYPMDFKSKFTDILSDAVTMHSDHVINAKVEFINRPYIKDVKSSAQLINGINIYDIYTDALKYHDENKKQIVHAPKKFVDPIEIKFSVVKYKLDSLYVNGVNVVELNNTIYRKNQGNYVSEKKDFVKTPVIGELNVIDGNVNGVNLANVAFKKDGKQLSNLYVEHLQVSLIDFLSVFVIKFSEWMR